MKNIGSTFLIFALITLGYVGFGSWYWPCKVKGLCENQSASISTPKPPPPPPSHFSHSFDLLDTGQVIFAAKEGIRFGKHSDVPVYGSDITQNINKLVSYLSENENKDVKIYGIFGPEDTLPSGKTERTLGLARAHQIRNLLVNAGISNDRIVSYDKMSRDKNLYDPQDTLQGGIYLGIATREASEDGPVNPLVEPFPVYFETNQSYVNLDSALEAKITQTIQYLRSVDGSHLYLVGHTDSDGDSNTNLGLGLDRANEMKATFVDYGLSPDQIDTSSKGESEPKADNDTDAGKALNRRVEMRISN